MSILDLKPPRPAAETSAAVSPIRNTAAQDVTAAARPPWYRRPAVLGAFGGAILLLGVATWLAIDWSQSATVLSLRHLETTVVARGRFVQDVAARGTVIAAESPTLVATAAGTVHYLVHAGDRVRKGQVLAVATSPLLQNEYQRQFATLNSMPLARHFLDGQHLLSQAAERALARYPWPGNVRELRNVIQRACLLSEAPQIGVSILNLPVCESAPSEAPAPDRASVEAALTRHEGNVSRAARELGVSRQALYRRMEKLGLKSDA